MRIVFDLDDTLYLERDYVRSGFSAVGDWLLAKIEVSGFFEIAWNLFLEGRRGDIFNQALLQMNLHEHLVSGMVETYRTHAPDIQLLADVSLFLRNHGVNDLSIISDGYARSQWEKVRALGVENWIKTIIITDDWGRDYWKPHTRAFEKAQQDEAGECCVYIGDNPLKDFIAPAKLGWCRSIRVRRPGSLHYEMPTPPNCVEVASMDEVPAVLAA